MDDESRNMGLSAPALPPSTTWIRGGCIGRGAFGTVSLAVDKSSGRVFAVKSVRLDPSASSPSLAIHSLENEIRILRSLSCRYIVSYVGDGTTADSTAEVYRNLIMEYVPGGTVAGLAARCRDKGGDAMDESAVRSYTRCVARALQYLHDVGCVHGDVKGRNILVGSTPGEAKLADFGSARRITAGGDCSEAANDHLLGTPPWMAPEVVGGEGTSPASDVWSLGCTVIEMVTGKPPWSESGHKCVAHLLLRIALGDEVPEFPSRLSNSGRDFLDKCLRRDPGERWSCEQLLRHPFLAEAAGQSPRSALEWTNFELDSSEDEEDGKLSDNSTGGLRDRVREMASNGEMIWEDGEGWEVVRSVPSSPSPCLARDQEREATAAAAAEGEREGTSTEYLDGEVRGWEGRGGDASGGRDGGGQPDATGCASPSARRSCSYYYCCRDHGRTVGGPCWWRGVSRGRGASLLWRQRHWGREKGFIFLGAFEKMFRAIVSRGSSSIIRCSIYFGGNYYGK